VTLGSPRNPLPTQGERKFNEVDTNPGDRALTIIILDEGQEILGDIRYDPLRMAA